MKAGIPAIRARTWARLAGMGVVTALAALVFVPFPAKELECFPAATVLTDRLGTPLRVELGPHWTDCRPVYQPEEPDWIAQAIVAAEDQRFWSHPGVDPLALARAVRQNLLSLRKVSGASTISTQVIRLMEPRPRTLWAKGVEAFRALQLERRLTKDEVLAQYLNRAPFGGNIVGIEAAARRYFGKGAHDLSLAEAALLAGLPQSPSRLRPDRNLERAKKRQGYVLGRMAACGMISEQERADAFGQRLAVRPATYPFLAPHFCDAAGSSVALARGLAACATTNVRTTLDPKLQRIAEEALRRHAGDLARGDIRGGAVVILDVRDSAVRAMVGSPDFRNARAFGEVNAAVAPRSAGSTLKPFAFAMAFDRGLMTPQTVLADVPRLFRDYEPENFDETFRGLVTARDALILSLNMPAIDVERRVGQPVFFDALKSLGFSTLTKPAATYGLGLVIGNGEVRLLDLANAYACLARGGGFKPARFLETGDAGTPSRPVFSREASWLVSDILGGGERGMDSVGHSADVQLPPLAWKTGTSAGFRDAWTVAYNPDYVIGVWAGNPDGASSELLVGRKVATPIVWEIFRRIYPDNDGPWFERPGGLERREICAVSGRSAGTHCRNRIEDWHLTGVSGFRACEVHRLGEEDAWPAEVASFFQRQQAPAAAPGLARLRITSPAGGSTFRALDGMAAGVQKLPLAAMADARERLYWFVNDRYLGEAPAGQPLLWPLRRGSFQIVCSDGAGRSDRVRIAVE